MSENHGRFIWCELMTPDTAGGKAFYGDVVGWTSVDMAGPDGPYTRFETDGYGVGGMMRLSDAHTAGNVPPNWTGYICSDDVDADAEKARRLGGSIMGAPWDIPGIGRVAIIADPSGAVFAMMTPAPTERPTPPEGTQGLVGWNELMGDEPAAALRFYGEMFGWQAGEGHDMGPMGVYQLFRNQDGEVGGMMKRPPHMPVSAWNYYYTVPDIQAAAARVKAGGGQVLNGPMEVPGGDWVLNGQDPQGAMFSLTTGGPRP